MRITQVLTAAVVSAVVAGTGVIGMSAANAATPSCASITKVVVVKAGYTGATGPVVTHYNYAKPSANAANSLGTTLDFGPKALVVACVSPSDIVTLSKKAKGMKMTADQYLAYMAKQSAGAMKKTTVGGVTDYLDFGNGKEDGLGSTASAGSIRLDSWVAGGKYIILTFSQPASAKPTTSLLNFIKATNTVL